MPKVILQPSGQDLAAIHYHDTILHPVAMSKLGRYLSRSEMDKLKGLYPGDQVPTWGVTPGKKDVNRKKWDRVERGDITLFSGPGGVFASAVVALKAHNPGLAVELWDRDEDGETWEYMYFLDEHRALDLPYSQFNRLMGYKPNYVIQGFNVLAQDKSERFLAALGLWGEAHVEKPTQKEYEKAVRSFDLADSLDTEHKTRGRKEQAFLRDQLLGDKREAECGICGRLFPVELLVAAHIKKRAECSVKEMLDFKHIAMPMCHFGCDRLYELGYISVRNGVVRASSGSAGSPYVQGVLSGLEGRPCNYWNKGTEPYFSWHNKRHGFD